MEVHVARGKKLIAQLRKKLAEHGFESNGDLFIYGFITGPSRAFYELQNLAAKMAMNLATYRFFEDCCSSSLS